MDITFTTTEEQDLLRETIAKWLTDRSGSPRVRELMATDDGFDDDEWGELAEMGVLSLAIPEAHGGAGYGWTETGVVAEEMGRALLCAPFLSSAVLATAALLAAGDEVAEELLPRLAGGELRATLAPRTDHSHVEATDGALHGTARFVLDGHTADVLLVAARDGDDATLFAVESDADGLEATAMDVMDQTRKQAELTLDGVEGRVVGGRGGAHALADRARLVGAAVLANEQVGGARKVLDDSVEYGRTRMQFGRAIGSYQALKHRMADTLKEIEAARSAAYHAVRAIDAGDDDEIEVAVPLAASWVGEIYERAAAANIQNHGGIAFTWEHDAHLWLKRAKSSTLLLGTATSWRDRLGRALQL